MFGEDWKQAFLHHLWLVEVGHAQVATAASDVSFRYVHINIVIYVFFS